MIILNKLRNTLVRKNLDGLLIPRWGKYGGELLLPGETHLEDITGFSGSAGFTFIAPERAYMLVDGRYTDQAAQECPEFTVLEGTLRSFPSKIKPFEGVGIAIGIDPAHFTVAQVRFLEAHFEVHFLSIEEMMQEARAIQFREIAPPFIIPTHHAGASTGDKIKATLAEYSGAAIFIHDPEELCWLLNVRGFEADTTPLLFGRAILTADATLHVAWENDQNDGLDFPYEKVVTYNSVESLLASFKRESSILTSKSAPFALVHELNEPVYLDSWPLERLKAIKNEVEIAGMEAAQTEDNRHFIQLMCWLDNNKYLYREVDVVEKLRHLRGQNPSYVMDSFDSIVGAGPNGAIIHYRPTENEINIADYPTLLIDTGAHYKYGTTDTTRTLAPQGEAPEAIKELYTRVLKGHLRLLITPFPKHATGAQLDALARQDLWAVGRDYKHGTGHGVGHMLNVHEGPFGISPRTSLALAAGAIVTVEPGYYEAGEFGIRIENVAVVEEAEQGFLKLRTLTFVPYARELIVPNLLHEAERQYINWYHEQTFERHEKALTLAEKAWLKKATTPL